MATTYKDFSVKKGIIAENGHIHTKGGNHVIIESAEAKSVSLAAPGEMAANYTLTLPTTAGTADQILKTDGTGALSWTDDVGLSYSDLSVGANAAASGSGGLAYNPANGTFTYTPPDLSGYEPADATILKSADIGTSVQGYDANIVSDANYAHITVTATSVSDGTTTFDQYDDTDLAGRVGTLENAGYLTSETVTSLSIASNKLTYTDESGTATEIDLSLYLDDTNLARLTSGTVDGGTGIATFTRDDESTFAVDFSALFDDTNLTRITTASFTDGTLTLSRSDESTVTVSLDGRYLQSYTETDPVFNAHTSSGITNGTGLLKNDGNGTWTYDNSTYLTSYTETDTLDSVTGRGASTTNDITVGSVTTGGTTFKSSTATGTTITSVFPVTSVGAKIILAVDAGSGSRQMSEFLVVTDGSSDVFVTEYATVFTSSEIPSTVTGAINAGNCTVTATFQSSVTATMTAFELT
jgi:hypothetical protein